MNGNLSVQVVGWAWAWIVGWIDVCQYGGYCIGGCISEYVRLFVLEGCISQHIRLLYWMDAFLNTLDNLYFQPAKVLEQRARNITVGFPTVISGLRGLDVKDVIESGDLDDACACKTVTT